MEKVLAIILAAGESRRMGRPKMLLPWGDSTLLGAVISVYSQVLGREAVLVVSGGSRDEVESVATKHGAACVFNAEFRAGSMLKSIQVGLAAAGADISTAMIGLGDQPQLQAASVRALLDALAGSTAALIVPSYQNRRGHPWLIRRSLWPALLSMAPLATARDFLAQHAAQIEYVSVSTTDVIEDLDTPDDYATYAPAPESPT